MALKILIMLTAVAVAASLPSQDIIQPRILKYENNNNGNGKYSFEFETSDGTYRQEDGGVVGAGGGGLVVRGLYRYVGSDGRLYSVHYVADNKGYQPRQTDSLADSEQQLDGTRFNDRRFV